MLSQTILGCFRFTMCPTVLIDGLAIRIQRYIDLEIQRPYTWIRKLLFFIIRHKAKEQECGPQLSPANLPSY